MAVARVGTIDFTHASKAYFSRSAMPTLFRQNNAPADFVKTANLHSAAGADQGCRDLMPVFRGAVDATFAASGIDAVYTPAGSEPVAVRVIACPWAPPRKRAIVSLTFSPLTVAPGAAAPKGATVLFESVHLGSRHPRYQPPGITFTGWEASAMRGNFAASDNDRDISQLACVVGDPPRLRRLCAA
jgi:hypothetical protein